MAAVDIRSILQEHEDLPKGVERKAHPCDCIGTVQIEESEEYVHIGELSSIEAREVLEEMIRHGLLTSFDEIQECLKTYGIDRELFETLQKEQE